MARETPQAVFDFVILLDNGYGRTKALVLHPLSAAALRQLVLLLAESARSPYFTSEAKP